jgi:hypothetical protein
MTGDYFIQGKAEQLELLFEYFRPIHIVLLPLVAQAGIAAGGFE